MNQTKTIEIFDYFTNYFNSPDPANASFSFIVSGIINTNNLTYLVRDNIIDTYRYTKTYEYLSGTNIIMTNFSIIPFRQIAYLTGIGTDYKNINNFTQVIYDSHVTNSYLTYQAYHLSETIFYDDSSISDSLKELLIYSSYNSSLAYSPFAFDSQSIEHINDLTEDNIESIADADAEDNNTDTTDADAEDNNTDTTESIADAAESNEVASINEFSLDDFVIRTNYSKTSQTAVVIKQCLDSFMTRNKKPSVLIFCDRKKARYNTKKFMKALWDEVSLYSPETKVIVNIPFFRTDDWNDYQRAHVVQTDIISLGEVLNKEIGSSIDDIANAGFEAMSKFNLNSILISKRNDISTLIYIDKTMKATVVVNNRILSNNILNKFDLSYHLTSLVALVLAAGFSIKDGLEFISKVLEYNINSAEFNSVLTTLNRRYLLK